MSEQRFERVETKLTKIEDNQEIVKSDVSELKSDVSEIRARLDSHSDMLSFIIKKMDDSIKETRRWGEVLLENSNDNYRASIDGVQGNREKLSSHETRLKRLEVS